MSTLSDTKIWVQLQGPYRSLALVYYNVPGQAVIVSIAVSGSHYYIGRAKHNGDWRLCVIHKPSGQQYYNCTVAYDGKEYLKPEAETQVLVLSSYSWKNVQGGKMPVGAVPRGYSYEGEPLYIGRAISENGGVCLGQINPKQGECYFPIDNKSTTHYECLIVDEVPLNTQIHAAKSHIEGDLLSAMESKFNKIDIKNEETANMINEMRARLDTLEASCKEVGTLIKEKLLPEKEKSSQQEHENIINKDSSEITLTIKVGDFIKQSDEEIGPSKNAETVEDEGKP